MATTATYVFHATNEYLSQAALVAKLQNVNLNPTKDALVDLYPGLTYASDTTAVEGNIGAMRTIVVNLPASFNTANPTAATATAALTGLFAADLNLGAQTLITADPVVIA